MVGSYVNFGIKTSRRLLDVVNLSEVMALCHKHRPEAIIHLAAETDIDKCESDPKYAYMVNAVGTYNVALAAKELNAKLVYISTAGVFDGNKEGPYNEEDIPNPKNYYGRSKHLGELLITSMLENYAITRACWMFGGGPTRDYKFVSKIIKQLNKKEIGVVTDQLGSPTFGKDLVEGIKIILREDLKGTYNLANNGVCSRYDFAKLIVDILGKETIINPIKMSDFDTATFRPYNEGLSSTKIPRRPWQEAIKEYLEAEWK